MMRPGVNPLRTSWTCSGPKPIDSRVAELGHLGSVLRQQRGELREGGNEDCGESDQQPEDGGNRGSRGDAPGNSPGLHPAANGMNTQSEHERKKYRGDDSPHRAQAERHHGRASQEEQYGDGAGEGRTWVGFR